MAKLFNDFGNMLESRQTINWNLKINQFESETRTCVDARYLQEHFWQCSQNMCGRALLAKTFWKCNQNRCGRALLAKTIDESPRLPWSSQSFRVLGLTWNGGKWLADIASNFPVKALRKKTPRSPQKSSILKTNARTSWGPCSAQAKRKITRYCRDMESA